MPARGRRCANFLASFDPICPFTVKSRHGCRHVRCLVSHAARSLDWRGRISFTAPNACAGSWGDVARRWLRHRLFYAPIRTGRGLRVTGLDPDRDGLAYARAHASPNEVYIAGDARELPFPDASFDFVVSSPRSVSFRISGGRCRKSCALPANVLRWGCSTDTARSIGRRGAAAGRARTAARTGHTISEIHDLLRGLAVHDVLVRTAVFDSSAGAAARVIERLVPNLLPWGAFIAVVGTASAL